MALQRAVRSDTQEKFKFDKKGDQLKGYYLTTTEIEIDGRQVKKHLFKTTNGVVSVLGQADMYQQLVDNKCERSYVEITFTGNTKKLKVGAMKLYNVDFDHTDRWEGDVESEEQPEFAADEPETDVDADETPMDEVPATRPQAPRTRAAAPDAKRAASVQALLGGKRTG